VRVTHGKHVISLTLSKRATALLAIALAAVALGALASSAGAVIVTLPDGKTPSYQPLRGASGAGGSGAWASGLPGFDEAFANLEYTGGPVMPSNTNYAVYWDPEGGPAYPAEYQAGLNRYFEDLAHDSGGHENVESVSAQYNDSSGAFAAYSSHFGGALIDKDAYPSNGCSRAVKCITLRQIEEELVKFIEANALPADLQHEYFLITPPGVEDCFEEGAAEQCSAGSTRPAFCAYHFDVPLEEGGVIVFANDPYVTGNAGCDDGNHPNRKPSDGLIEGGLSHEHNESITDPVPPFGWAELKGPLSGEEIGDKCRTFKAASEFGQVLEFEEEGKKFKYNQVINGHRYWYQQEWSNQGHGCAQRLAFSGSEPTATFTAEALSATRVRFDASGSTATGGVKHYDWQFNDYFGELPNKPLETSSPVVEREFPYSGESYLVALTVYGEDGTSIGAARRITVGLGGPTARFSISPSSAGVGQSVTFNGSASGDTGGTITSYSWSFGDGTGASGVSVSHAYAAPGVYRVTLAVTGSEGLTSRSTQELTVGASGGTQSQTVAPVGSGAPAGPVQPPPAVVAATGNVTLLSTNATSKSNGASAFKLSCTGNTTCSGTLTLTVKPKRKGAKPQQIGSARFSILAGKTLTITIVLNGAGRAKLKAAHGKLGATLTILKSAPSPQSRSASTVHLTLKKKGKR
jgi:PKD repeat protein